jgi:hypothetical protein
MKPQSPKHLDNWIHHQVRGMEAYLLLSDLLVTTQGQTSLITVVRFARNHPKPNNAQF